MIPIFFYLVAINLGTLFMYWFDKRAAQHGGWRVSEFMLLMLGLAGGTVAAFAAQRLFRHKNRKASFQFKFWTLTLVQVALLLFPPAMLKHLFRVVFAY